MSLQSDLVDEISTIFEDGWTKRKGRVVPIADDIRLSNDAVEFEKATVLYADLSGSTALVDSHSWMFAAEIYKAYLRCAAKLVRSGGGAITSYDGDRIMGVFIGDNQSSTAARCALKLNYAVQKIINPCLADQYPNKTYSVKQVVGIDTSVIRVARTGVRGDNDLVWIGRAANYAAKLTEIKKSERSWITQAVYNRLNDNVKFSSTEHKPMWKQYKWSQNGDQKIYGSTWRQSF